eukprot:9309443-Heterocapsa_arctica.AAC.1
MNIVWDVEEKRRQSTSRQQRESSGGDNLANRQKGLRDTGVENITTSLMDGGHAVDVSQKDLG